LVRTIQGFRFDRRLVRTIQAWLGHKNLETTMIYLGVTDSGKLRSNINAAFEHWN